METAPDRHTGRMRVFVTGGAGFIGRSVVGQLAARGDTVVAAVRNMGVAQDLNGPTVHLVYSDLGTAPGLRALMTGSDAVIHLAGMYRVGITDAERGAMWEANVAVTERVLDAAEAARISRVVVVSTVNVLGNTHGRTVDERHRRDLSTGFLSYYDETKYRAYELAAARAAAGRPIVIAMPGGVYGPGDHSEIGGQLRRAYEGRLRFSALDDVGICFVYVEDAAAGILGCLDHGRVGETYALTGVAVHLHDVLVLAARLGGHKPPRVRVPTSLLRGAGSLGGVVGRVAGVPPNLTELISASAGVTYWVSNAKATRELGFTARPVADGLRETWPKA